MGFRVYGDTKEDRDRVLRYLEGDMPELDMEYMEKAGKRFPNTPSNKNDFDLKPEDLDMAIRFIRFFSSHGG